MNEGNQGNEDNLGAVFLSQRYSKLSGSQEVTEAAKHTKRLTREDVPRQPAAIIQNYLDRLRKTIYSPEGDARVKAVSRLKRILFEKHVIELPKPKNPESEGEQGNTNSSKAYPHLDNYWTRQIEITRNQGRGGDWQDLTEEEKLEIQNGHLAQVREDQKGSIEEWIDYLVSVKSSYLPDYLKYWAFAGMLGLERYKKTEKDPDGKVVELGRFPKRSSGKQRSVKMFPEVNENGLKFIASAYKAQGDNKPIYWGYNNQDIPNEVRQSFLDALAKKDFRAAYGWVQEHIPPITDEEMQITEGGGCGWVTFSKQQGDTGKDVADTLVGKGTGWCIAGSETAQNNYLDNGAKLHIYYTRDKHGKQTNPRVVIVSEGDRVTEVRGIEWEENLDDYIKASPVIGEKLKQLPGGQAFFATETDTKLLTVIDRKIGKDEVLTSEELKFLYAIDRPIKYFGYKEDPRIKELRNQRNLAKDIQTIYGFDLVAQRLGKEPLDFMYGVTRPVPEAFANEVKKLLAARKPKEDMPIVFDCKPSQIAHNVSEVKPDTKAYVGPLGPGIFPILTEANVEYIYTSFPEGKIPILAIEIGGKTKEQLQSELEQAGVNTTSLAKDMTISLDFTTLPEVQILNTVRLTLDQMGLSGFPTTDQVHKRAQELGLYLCPAEVGPQYRLQYTDQPIGEWFYVGMKQITDSVGYPSVFLLVRDEVGLWLYGSWAIPDDEWYPSSEFVFSLRKV